MYHVNEVSKWLNDESVAPIYIEIGPINACNHKCIFCALDYLKSKGSMIKKEVLISNLKNMAEFGVKAIMFGGEGEPLAYPHIIEATQKAKEFGLDISITTNGVLFDEKLTKEILGYLSWIKFSIDAGTRKTYAKIHGCKEEDFDKVINNIKFACEYRDKNDINTTIGSQILLIQDNIEEVEILIQKIKKAGADYLILKPYSQHPKSVNKLVLDIKKYDKKLKNLVEQYSDEKFKVIYRDTSAKEIETNKIKYKNCFGLNFFTLIDALGNVIPCNLFYEEPNYIYGNINENNFEQIWRSKKRQEVINIIHSEGIDNCRRGCRLNFVNKYLNDIKLRNIEHINFI